MFISIGCRLPHARLHFIPFPFDTQAAQLEQSMLPPMPHHRRRHWWHVSFCDAVKMSVNFHEWQTIVDLKLLPNKITIKSNLYHRRLTATDANVFVAFFLSHSHFAFIFYLCGFVSWNYSLVVLNFQVQSAFALITMFQSNALRRPFLSWSAIRFHPFARLPRTILPIIQIYRMHIEYFSSSSSSSFCFLFSLIWQLT